MKHIYKLILSLALVLGTQNVQAQCTSCTYTYNGSGSTSFNLNTNERLCITGSNASSLSVNFNGSPNYVCVNAGVTFDASNLNFNNTQITVNGVMTLNNNNFNSASIINVPVGGVLNIASSGLNNNCTVNNYGTVNFTNTGSVNVTGSTVTFNNYAGGTINATTPSLLNINNCTFNNSGTMNLKNFENSDGYVANTSSGRLYIANYFYNHGQFQNDGKVWGNCGSSGANGMACIMTVGNKGAGREFRNVGCLKFEGTFNNDGPVYNDGIIEITGNTTLNNPMSGTNGKLIVLNGVSTITAAGSYTGTNMKFCDQNTSGNNFDAVAIGRPVSYSVDCSPNTCFLTISGNVYRDANGLTDATVGGTGIGNPNSTQLYAYFISSSNVIMGKAAVNTSTGAFAFSDVQGGGITYTVMISTDNLMVGNSFTGNAALPSGWAMVGENFGTNNGAGTGNESGTPNLKISVTVNSNNVNALKFGIEQLPTSTSVSAGTYVNPGSTNTVQVPLLKGVDPEDGAKGQGSTFVINILPSNANLYYNGVSVTAGQVISNYDSTLLRIDPTFSGSGTVSVTFSSRDAAGQSSSSTATATVTFSGLTVSGQVFLDANGLTDNTVNGTGINTASSTQLYAYLSQGGVVIDKVTLVSSGVFSFTSKADANSSYSVIASTTNVSIGAATPTAALPSGWAYVGEAFGANNSAGSGNESGTPNGNITVTTGASSSVTGVNFGIEQLPTSTSVSIATQINPGGTNTIQVPGLKGADTEDGAKGQGSTFVINTLPLNANLYYNGVLVTAGQVITSYDSTLLRVDPTFSGTGTVTFSFSARDAAAQSSTNPATVTIPFTGISVSGQVFLDANGLIDGAVNGTGLGSPVTVQLYAYLVQSGLVVDKVTLPANGVYSFNGTASPSTSYTVILSSTSSAIGATAPTSSNLPSGWVSVGENFGTGNSAGSGNESGTPNSQIAVTTTTSNVTGVNFGIEQLPTATSTTAASQLNPGGTNRVQVIGLRGTDPEDGIKTQGSTFVINTPPTNATLYYNNVAVTAGQVITNYDSTLLRLDPNFNGAGTVTFTVSVRDAAGQTSASSATVTMPFTGLSISGTLFNDANGLTDATVNGTGVGSPSTTQAYAYLVAGGVVVDKVTIPSNGVYSFSGTADPSTAYTVLVSTTNVAIGAATPSVTLPTGWLSVGEAFGTNNTAGTGNESGTPNSSIAVTTGASSSVTGVNFGIERLPVANNVTSATQVTPAGTTRVQVIGLNGTDAEDGNKTQGSTFVINTLPTNATLFYNGVAVTAGQVITNYDSTLLTVDPTFTVSGTVSFTFSVRDAAGQTSSTTATATMPFNGLTVSGTVFNDANGLTDATVNGTGIGTASATQLYAYLVDGSNVVIDKVTLPSNGVYSFNGTAAPSTAYTVRISTTNVAISATAPAAASLPTGWVSTGENFGTGNSAGTGNESGTANSQIAVTTTSSNVTAVNFGIEQTPTAVSVTSASVLNPGGTTQISVIGLTGTDPEDGDKTQGSTFVISSLPSNATLYYNGTAVTAGQVISNYDSTLLTVDPSFSGSGTIAFNYTVIDQAGQPSTNVATATIPVGGVNISGNVYDDANGLTDGIVNGTSVSSVSGSQLYAYLVEGGVVIGKSTVTSGAYSFSNNNASSGYSVVISTNNVAIGASTPAVGLPAGWVTTGENNCGNTAGCTGNDGTANSILTLGVVTGNLTQVNFGIEQLPTPATLTATSQVNPGGTSTVTVSPTTFGGTDPDGVISSIIITSFPTNATSIVINGTSYTSATFPLGGVTVPTNASGQPTQTISVDPIDGAVTVGISYVVVDNAGMQSTTTGTANVPFTSLTISGTVFNDNNAGTPDLGNQSTNNLPGTQLYVNLVDSVTGKVVSVATVNSSTGAYILTGVGMGGYYAQLSTVQGTIGNNPPAGTLPGIFQNVGSNTGINNSATDGTLTDGIIPVSLGTSGAINVNFGINETPTSVSSTLASQPNPGGTNNVTIPSTAFSGTDPNGGSIQSITITSFPTNTNSITINGTTYTSGTFPVGGVTIPTNTLGQPTQSIALDPISGATTPVITYTVKDSANLNSTSATVNVPLTPEIIVLSGNLFYDGNALIDSMVSGRQDILPSTVYAVLINPTTRYVYAVMNIPSSGATAGQFSFSIAGGTNYRLMLRSGTPPAVGSTAPVLANPPSGFAFTGEFVGTGVGSDGTVDGRSITISTGTANVPNINFGIRKILPPIGGE